MGIQPEEIERTLLKIKGVKAARVVLDSQSKISELHVLAAGNRPPRYLVRDIESSVMAAFGIQVDRCKISIAQLEGDDFPIREKRVRLEKVAIVSESGNAEVKVDLEYDGDTVTGVARGVASPHGWLRVTAEAAVEALAKLVASSVSLTLSDVTVTSMKTSRVALVTIAASLPDGTSQILTGSCPVSYDEREAIVKATLDAVNRRLTVFARGSEISTESCGQQENMCNP